jgi:hypothetical protein
LSIIAVFFLFSPGRGTPSSKSGLRYWSGTKVLVVLAYTPKVPPIKKKIKDIIFYVRAADIVHSSGIFYFHRVLGLLPQSLELRYW